QPIVGSAGARGGEERHAREPHGRGGGALEKRPAIDRLGHRYCLLGVESAGMVTRGRGVGQSIDLGGGWTFTIGGRIARVTAPASHPPPRCLCASLFHLAVLVGREVAALVLASLLGAQRLGLVGAHLSECRGLGTMRPWRWSWVGCLRRYAKGKSHWNFVDGPRQTTAV